MTTSRISTLCTLAAAAATLVTTGSIDAQGTVAPFRLNVPADSSGLSLRKLGVSAAKSLNAIQLPGDPAGTYYISMTVSGLSSARGGVGGNDFLTGRYDAIKDSFTENLDAAKLNTSVSEFQLGLHASGLFAVYDRSGGQPVLATRSSTKTPFVARGRISGLPSQSWYDPNLATVDGKLHIVCRVGRNLAMAPLNVATRVAGKPIVIARPFANGDLNSAAPIVDSKGEMIAISYHDLTGGDNDHYVAFDLDPATPGLLVTDTTTFYSNGTFLAGRYLAALSTSSYRITRRDCVLCTGGQGPVGGKMEVAAYVPADLASSSTSFLMFSSSFVKGLSIPGFSGSLGIGFGGWNILPIGQHAMGTARASLTLTIPQRASLKGAVVPAQALTVETKSKRLIFGNTCSLRVQ